MAMYMMENIKTTSDMGLDPIDGVMEEYILVAL